VETVAETTDNLSTAHLEGLTSQEPANAVETRSLTRRYGSLVAVNHLNFTCPSSVIVRDPRAVRRSIGYVSQMLSADGDLSAYENLSISAKLYGVPRSERGSRIAHALEFMDLSHVTGKQVKHFSGGMIRKLEIAQSMLHRPAILFLDEPTVGLDPIAKQSVWQNIRDLREEFGTTILMTTHDMQEADELCETVAFMHSGQLAAVGPPARLKLALGPSASLGDVFIHYTGATIAEGGDFRDAARLRSTTRRLG
jgi:ABC-2 type transport system ATP-binding protein